MKGRLPGIPGSLQTPMSILVNSTISDEGMAGVLESQSSERKFMADRLGAPAKTSHATQRRRDETNIYAKRVNHRRGLSEHKGG